MNETQTRRRDRKGYYQRLEAPLSTLLEDVGATLPAVAVQEIKVDETEFFFGEGEE